MCEENSLILARWRLWLLGKGKKPTTVTEVRSFLGFDGYYKHFPKITLPLTKHTQKKINFIWSGECEYSFEELKNRLVTTPMLTIPSGSSGQVIFSDASNYGLDCVLMQHGKVSAFAFKQLKPYELNYPTHELELVTMVFTLNIQRHYFHNYT